VAVRRKRTTYRMGPQAKRLERDDCAAILEQNLQEEQAADQRLAELAECDADLRAA